MKNIYRNFMCLIFLIMYGLMVPLQGSVPLTTGTIAGVVTDCITHQVVSGVTVVCGTQSGLTNLGGQYSIPNVPAGVQNITATLVPYQPYGPVPVTIIANQTTVTTFCMQPNINIVPIISGHVTEALTGIPIIGAIIVQSSLPNNFVYSTGPDGAYTLTIYPAATTTLTISKDGFVNYVVPSATYTPPTVYNNLNIQMLPVCNPPSNVISAVNTGQTAVNINWTVPKGNYLLNYDDGIQDNFAIWANAGNLDAMKITPAGYPATVLGAMIHIGWGDSYPPGGGPVTFKVALFDTQGPGGIPGNQISNYIDFVVPANKFGWIDYPSLFGTGVLINNGGFYIVTKQVGNYPNAAGIGVDTTTNQLRSYQKSGSSPWMPISGNFMIRAHMFGSGGPFLATSVNPGDGLTSGAFEETSEIKAQLNNQSSDNSGITPDNPTNSESPGLYKVWRLMQGQENNPSAWVSLGTTPTTNFTDNSWPSLPCQVYRWAVEAEYAGNRWSSPAFSNGLSKCYTANVVFNVSLSCTAIQPIGVQIKLQRHNPGTPPPVYDSTYISYTPASGIDTLKNIVKGTYDVTVSKWGYTSYTQIYVSILGDTTFNVFLPQIKAPVRNIIFHDTSMCASWRPPLLQLTPIFNENWSSGSFITNGWSVTGGTNWQIFPGAGNPAPSAGFNWTPQVTNYDQYLTSPGIQGVQSPGLSLTYDIYLNNYATTYENTMSIELWNGTSWQVLKTYTNLAGSFNWKTETLNISSVASSAFKIRFHAAGVDSYDLNNWNIDNIKIIPTDYQNINPCILGYNFYVNNVLTGTTQDTFFCVPCNMYYYGELVTGCVEAIWGSGLSSKVCNTQHAWVLPPVNNLTGTAVTNSSYLTWSKPNCFSSVPPGLLGYNVYRNNIYVHYVPGPDSLSWYDYNLLPGTYTYHVRAKYDRTAYGYPGTAESLNEIGGPAIVNITYGFPLPFVEQWNNGKSGFGNWTFDPNQGNWIINAMDGNLPPSANFTWQPIKANYSFALVSPAIDASQWTCSKIWLDFDYKLADRDANGTEKMDVDVEYDNVWHQETELKNQGSVGWNTMHLDISAVKGKGLLVRFRANGSNTQHILNWFIDNIKVYGTCLPPLNLVEQTIHPDTVTLNWNPPNCNSLGEEMAESSQILGYNIWRTNWSAQPPFMQLNTSPVNSTSYTDVIGYDSITFGNTYKYYVTALFNDVQNNTILCESSGSDTVSVEIYVGMGEKNASTMTLFPNPASFILNIKSIYKINRVEILNFFGECITDQAFPGSEQGVISISSFPCGVYFARVTTTRTTRIIKFAIVK